MELFNNAVIEIFAKEKEKFAGRIQFFVGLSGMKFQAADIDRPNGVIQLELLEQFPSPVPDIPLGKYT